MNAFDEQQMLAAVAERDALLDDANTRLAERLELIDKLRQELDEATSKLDSAMALLRRVVVMHEGQPAEPDSILAGARALVEPPK